MKESTLELYKERMLRVLVHIQQHLDERLPLEELAGVACFSPYHFHRMFRGMLGETYARPLGEWLPRSGRELRSAPCLERYLNDPESTDPEDLITEIYAPLEAR